MSAFEECLEKLGCPDEAERVYAAEDLGYLNLPEGVPALLDRLPDESSVAVRDAIFQALIRMDGEAAIEGAIRLLGSDDSQIRNQAVVVLRRKGARSLPSLARAMRTGDRDVRKLVLDVMNGMQAGGGGDIYAAALDDQDANVVIAAVENLGRIRAVEFRGRIEDLLRQDVHPMLTAACLEALVGIGEKSSLAAIRERFPEPGTLPDFLLGSYLEAMAGFGTASEFAELASLLEVRGAHLRCAIAGALLAIQQRCPCGPPDEDLLGRLRALAEDGDPPLARYQAVRVLGSWAARDDVFAFLVSCLSSPERLVRLGAAESLGATRRREAEDVLAARALEETDDEVRQALGC